MKILYFDELSSTNDFLKQEYKNYQDKTVIIAKKQTNGRGRLTRTWVSQDDLTFSILFKNEKKILYHMIAPLSIVYTLKKYNVEAWIKWPNDIYIDNKKVSGVLIENITDTNIKFCDIVGIGINFIEKEIENTTYLNKYGIFDKEDFLKYLLELFEMLLNLEDKDILDLYKIHSLLLGKRIKHDNEIFLIEDVTFNGELVLKNNHMTINLKVNEIDIKTSIIPDN